MKLNCSMVIILLLSLLHICDINPQDSIIGTWKGTSVCQVKDSPCHDEIAIYHAVKAEGNTYRFQMNKMVNGKEVEMGETVFTYDRNSETLNGITTSLKGKGLWHLLLKAIRCTAH